MKFASEEIRTKAVNAYLNEKIPFKRIIKNFWLFCRNYLQLGQNFSK